MELNPTWVQLYWGKHLETVSAKVPHIQRCGDAIPVHFAAVALELLQQDPYIQCMTKYLTCWAEFFSKGRDAALILGSLDILEAR